MTQLLLAHPLQVLGTPDLQLRIHAVRTLQARQTGWLLVDAGQVWITRTGDVADHVLAAGDALAVAPGQRLVVEPWRAGQVAHMRWAAGTLPPAALGAAAPDGHSHAVRPWPRPAPPVCAKGAWHTRVTALRLMAVRIASAARSPTHHVGDLLRTSVRPFGG